MTTVVGVVQRVDLALDPRLPLSVRELLEAHELRISKPELEPVSDRRIGRTMERVAALALPEGDEV